MNSLFDYEEEARRRQEELESLGVSDAMVESAGLLPVAPKAPKHWMEEVRERDGNAKFLGKMLLGGFTGIMPFVFPEAIGGNARYKAELEQYNKAQDRLMTDSLSQGHFDALSDDDPSNDLAAVRKLAAINPDVYGQVLKEMESKRLAPDAATYTEGDWEWDHDYFNGEGKDPGRWFVNRQGSDGSMKRDYAETGFEPQSALPGPEWVQGELGKSQESIFTHEGNASGARTVMSQMDRIGEDAWTSGIQAKAGEAWKYFTGTEDYVTSVRKNYSDIKVRNAINNLPPGVASDKDIELVMEPWPEGTSDFNFIRRKLEAIAKVEEGRSAYRRFEADYIAKNRKRDGLARAWAETEHAQRINGENAPPPTMKWKEIKGPTP